VTSSLPTDGGYGWVICAASFYTLFLAGGSIMCYGVIYVEFLDYFKESRTKTSMIGSLTLLSISLAGKTTFFTLHRRSWQSQCSLPFCKVIFDWLEYGMIVIGY
jgi:hypothetical protein